METITMTITAQTLNTIGVGLQELPFKVAQPAIAEVDAQVRAHLMAKKAKENGTSEGVDPTGAPGPDEV